MCFNLMKVKHKLKCFIESKALPGRPRQDWRALSSGTICTFILLEVNCHSHLRSSRGEQVPASWAPQFVVLAKTPLKFPVLNSRPHLSGPKDLLNQHTANILSASWILRSINLVSWFGLQTVVVLVVIKINGRRVQALKGATKMVSGWWGGAKH